MRPACGVCGKLYFSSSNLQRHVRNHSGEKHYKCGICGKLYSENDALQSHIKIHNDEKPYTCGVCGKSFSLSSYLLTHLIIHTDNVSLCGSYKTSHNTAQLEEPTHYTECTLPNTSLNNNYYSISGQAKRPCLRPRLNQETTANISSTGYSYNDLGDGEMSSRSEYDPGTYENVVSDSDNSVKSLIIPMSNTRSKSPIIHQNKAIAKQRFSARTKDTSTQISRITVMATNNDGNVRKWDKKHYCYFCSKAQAKLPRHLMTNHADKPEVIKLQAEKGLTARRNSLRKLRNLGNHKHNCDVIRKNSGQLIVGYRPTKQSVNPNDYGPCSYCYGYYIRQDLWNHRCPLKPQKPKHSHEDTNPKKTRICDRMAFKSTLLKPAQCGVLELLNKILVPMKCDEISTIVKSDDLILEVGKREYMRAGHEDDQHNYIRYKLRELGRLLWQLRKNTFMPNVCLQYFIDPKQFSTVIHSVHDLAGFKLNAHDFKIPSLAIKLGHTLKKCALIVKANALESNDKTLVETADNFYKLCDMKWETEISTHAHKTLNNAKRENPQALSSNEVKQTNNVSTGKETTMNSLAKSKVPIKKIIWSEDEIIAIQAFKKILHLRIPGKKDIEEVQQRNPVLKSRSWKKIKDYCRNNKIKILKGR